MMLSPVSCAQGMRLCQRADGHRETENFLGEFL